MSLNPDLNTLREEVKRIEGQTRNSPSRKDHRKGAPRKIMRKVFSIIVVIMALYFIIFQREKVVNSTIEVYVDASCYVRKLINRVDGVEQIVIKGPKKINLNPLPPQFVVVTRDRVNLRKDASPVAKVIAVEVQNSQLAYQNEYLKNGPTYWLKVRTSKGEIGWISDNIVKWNKESIALLKKDAKNGNVAAMKEFGRRFDKGIVMQADPKKALEWYKKAADAGEHVSQYLVGWYFQKGIGTKPDFKLALFYYRLSAEQGNASAMNSVGTFYADGLGVEKNRKQASLWFEKANEYGNLAD